MHLSVAINLLCAHFSGINTGMNPYGWIVMIIHLVAHISSPFALHGAVILRKYIEWQNDFIRTGTDCIQSIARFAWTFFIRIAGWFCCYAKSCSRHHNHWIPSSRTDVACNVHTKTCNVPAKCNVPTKCNVHVLFPWIQLNKLFICVLYNPNLFCEIDH